MKGFSSRINIRGQSILKDLLEGDSDAVRSSTILARRKDFVWHFCNFFATKLMDSWGSALREGVFAETKEGKCRNKREKASFKEFKKSAS